MWARVIGDSLRALPGEWVSSAGRRSEFRKRALGIVRTLAPKDSAGVLDGFARLLPEAGIVLTDWVLEDELAVAYKEYSGAPEPLLDVVEYRGLTFGRTTALAAMRSPLRAAEESIVLRWACDAAWLVQRWNNDEAYARRRGWRSDVVEAGNLLQLVYKLVGEEAQVAFAPIWGITPR